MKTSDNHIVDQGLLMKKIGAAGFLFFLIKGLLWLIVPIFMAYLGLGTN